VRKSRHYYYGSEDNHVPAGACQRCFWSRNGTDCIHAELVESCEAHSCGACGHGVHDAGDCWAAIMIPPGYAEDCPCASGRLTRRPLLHNGRKGRG
jgi:hypothetical protein